jgi:protein-tyrosine phosphatase
MNNNLYQDIVEVYPKIFISNWYTSNNPYIIDKYKIKAVITLETRPKPQDIINYYKNNNIDFMYIYIPDNHLSKINSYFDPTLSFIIKHLKKNENVLIHCYAGISRSSTIILNYIMYDLYFNKRFIMKPNDMINYALKIIRYNRHFIQPNIGFMHELYKQAVLYYNKSLIRV